jgi:hypothetical protein
LARLNLPFLALFLLPRRVGGQQSEVEVHGLKVGIRAGEYELSFRLFANGVSRDLLINYGDILIHGELTRLDFHEPASCADVKN